MVDQWAASGLHGNIPCKCFDRCDHVKVVHQDRTFGALRSRLACGVNRMELLGSLRRSRLIGLNFRGFKEETGLQVNRIKRLGIY